MTVAICIRCGARKLGALTLCSSCGFMPTDSRDKAKAMILTDHYLAVPDLEGLGERIRDGLPVTYPQEAIAGYIVMFEEEAARLSVRKRRMKLVAFLLALLAVFLLLAGCRQEPTMAPDGIWLTEVGSGPITVIMLHGFPGRRLTRTSGRRRL